MKRARLYALLARRARVDLVRRFAMPPEPGPTGGFALVPAREAWGVHHEGLFAPGGLSMVIVPRVERLKVALLAFLQRHMPNDHARTRLARHDSAELLAIIDGETPISHWPDMGTDAGWARLFVQGPMAGHLVRQGDDYVLDCTAMRGLEPHAGLVPLGCRAAVREGATGMEPAWVELEDGRVVRPGDPDWLRARTIFACAMQTWTVIVGHLLHVHYLTTGAVAGAAQTALPWSHPVRRLLEPHLLGTLLVNWRADRNLLGRTGAVQSAYSYPYAELMKLFARGVASFDPAHYLAPESIRQRGLEGLVAAGRYPFGEDAVLLWGVFERYVRRYIGLYYADDDAVRRDAELAAFATALGRLTVRVDPLDGVEALVSLLTRHIHVASAIHKQVGGIAWDFMTLPWFMPHRLRDVPEVKDMLPYQEESEANLVAKWSTTPMSWPLLRDWSAWALDPAGAEAMRSLQAELSEAGRTIDTRNAARAVPHPYLHPSFLESSVAV